MPSRNRIVVASAGSGKTTMIGDLACAAVTSRAALVTYTTNNTSGIEKLIYERIGHIPQHVKISTWYYFLLRHLVRPYQRALCPEPVKRIYFHNGVSAPFSKQEDIVTHYFGGSGCVYSDKVSKLACQIVKETGGKPIRRLEDVFDDLYIDEVQDLAGWDLELVEVLLRSRIAVTLVGDHRQATFSTHSAHKNKGYAGAKIIEKFKEWRQADLCDLEFQSVSRRCVQAICDFADRLHPEMPKTVSLNNVSTGHDGVFAVRQRDVAGYMRAFNPQTLRYDRRAKDVPGTPLNYGASKGLTFVRTLIFPNGPLQKYLLTGNPKDAGGRTKIYVAITRARQSTAIVVKNDLQPPFIPVFKL